MICKSNTVQHVSCHSNILQYLYTFNRNKEQIYNFLESSKSHMQRFEELQFGQTWYIAECFSVKSQHFICLKQITSSGLHCTVDSIIKLIFDQLSD